MPGTKVLQRRLLGQSFDLLSEFLSARPAPRVAEAFALAELWLVLGISVRTPGAQGMQRRGFHTLDSVRLSGRPGFRGTRPVRTCQAHPGDCQFLAI